MQKEEFEELAGYEVEQRIYTSIIEPMYMATNLDKHEFVKALDRKYFEKISEHEPNLKRMLIRNMLGEDKTPNKVWYYVKWVDLVDIDIKTGKYIVKDITDKDREMLMNAGLDQCIDTGFDFDYTSCVDVHGKPIELD